MKTTLYTEPEQMDLIMYENLVWMKSCIASKRENGETFSKWW